IRIDCCCGCCGAYEWRRLAGKRQVRTALGTSSAGGRTGGVLFAASQIKAQVNLLIDLLPDRPLPKSDIVLTITAPDFHKLLRTRVCESSLGAMQCAFDIAMPCSF